MCGNMGGGSSDGRGTASTSSSNGAPALDRELIRRANAAGTFVDYGDAGVRQYNRHIEEINGMDMTASEKAQAISELHSLMAKQLEAESKALSPYSMGVGPARFNRNKMLRAGDNAANARAEVSRFMNGLKQEQAKKARERQEKEFATAARSAFESGALEFTVNGTTWRRKSRRGKTFTADR